ncbi:3-keto-disaccharide hydrolase [Seonamhaeicola marinus]|uniref:DUF1080 domain-containing protein n=1 Tax=Seonamhaeicola marinus TaxID=1912246 RepID=A0A5D0HIH3_9FLAO|nr:DUF1080 domain-containing protein [Seonamhaeicola marinus]TYA69847.1 DUF1080 domain-containing protein [Seonamhaeicola marinus]
MYNNTNINLISVLCILTICTIGAQEKLPLLPNGWHVHDTNRPLPKKITPAETHLGAPSDAIVLFNGENFDQWTTKNRDSITWKLSNGFMQVTPRSGSIYTKQSFGDIQLHIEWFVPEEPTKQSQKKGISGIFLMGIYKLQVIDAEENQEYADGTVGAIYGQTPALVNAAKASGKWQSYDVIFTAPVFKNETLVSPAYITVFLNGVLIQNHTEIYGPAAYKTTIPYKAHPEKLPLMLQDHGQPVRFRNIWVRAL